MKEIGVAHAPSNDPDSSSRGRLGERVPNSPSGRRRPSWARVLRSRSVQVSLALLLILGGLTLAIGTDATPSYKATGLVESGSFFALASSGDTLYAASNNGGSIILEQSTDRGADWTPNPVPYSAVAGGAPWAHAAVAADGGHLVLVAATGGSPGGVFPVGQYYPSPYSPQPPQGCGANSTVLTATSPDGGRSWNTTTFTTGNLSVGTIQASVEGNLAGVAWLGTTTDCGPPVGEVGTMSSSDDGSSWSNP
ncbi:MAG: hypothetical protein L3J96_00950, partial [Thermoplasmata archaeon]|nr:hypothetical protein [Thermoplasmata archaeon]